MPGIRHFTAILAGASGLETPVFALFAYSGGIVWVLTFVSLGYFLGDQWSRMSEEVQYVLIALTILGVAAAVVYWWIRRRKKTAG